MRKMLLAAVSAIAIYYLFLADGSHRVSVEDVPEGQYVFVYGRDSCGYTARMRQQLEREGIQYRYYRVDESSVADSLHRRMRSAGLDTRRYYLPVVEVNTYMFVRPDLADVTGRYD